ncbi:hypothetical protein QYF36_006871 [Acer negundo]|nr:hypothetical protein QYF36_006871 [Acer negundo]
MLDRARMLILAPSEKQLSSEVFVKVGKCCFPVREGSYDEENEIDRDRLGEKEGDFYLERDKKECSKVDRNRGLRNSMHW